MELRYYQVAAVEAIWSALKKDQHPVAQLPTGAGKSLVIAEITRRVHEKGGRTLIATHVQELVEGNAAEFQRLTGVEPGILCAGLERTDKHHDVLFASVQSLYGPARRGEIPAFNLIIVDEAHLVQEQDSDAKFYPTTFSVFSDAQRLGVSATPWRMEGPIYGEGKFFTDLCYEVSVLELVNEGFLAPLVGVSASQLLDLDKIKKTAGEYDVRSVEEQETDEWLEECIAKTLELTKGRKHIAVFCPTVKVAERAADMFRKAGVGADYVVADTDDRTGKLERWKAGEFPVMCNVNILSTGFNFPALDTIVCLRPTESLSLWVQLLGRATRIAPGKKNALVVDFSGNLLIHGGICVGMEEAYSQKKDGSLEPHAPKPRERKPARKVKTAKDLTELDPMLANPKGFRARVLDIDYVVINSTSKPGKRLIMAAYNCVTEGGLLISASDFVMPEYDGYALQKTSAWFRRRGESSFPRSADSARTLCWGLPVPREVLIKKNGKYLNIEQEFF